jgi:hypothetical protein
LFGEVGKVGEVGFWPQAPKALGLFLATGFWFERGEKK